jgi:exonuclease SbcC
VRFERIRLRNFKPYDDADLRLGDGVTVIHGLNGSGKSSLLEACFFALYGSKALDETLEDVMTSGTEEAEIDLWFTHDGGEYAVERRLRASGDRVQTAKCVLDGPDGTIEGARAVRRAITDLLRMDADAFVNCAYVRQGEVNKLINASPGSRQTMIDDLLQLGKLEAYRERASEARLGVEDVLSTRRGSLQKLAEQIEAKADSNPHERLNALESERSRLDAEIERFERNRRDARETLEDARSVLDEHEERREKLAELGEDVASLAEQIAETERERETLREEFRDHRERIESLDDRIADLLSDSTLDDPDEAALESRIEELSEEESDRREAVNEQRLEAQALENQAETLESKAEDLGSRAEQKRDRAEKLEGDAEELAATLEDRRDRVAELEADIEAARARFDDAPVAFGEATSYREDVRADLESVRERERETSVELRSLTEQIREAESLLDEGKCPECGQPVEDSPHVESLAADRERREEQESRLSDLASERETLEDRLETAETLVETEARVERLEDRRESLTQLLSEREGTVEEKREQAAAERDTADELEREAEEKREAADVQAERAAAAREAVSDLREDVEAVCDRRERLETVRELLSDRAEAQSAVERCRDRRENLADLNDERRDRLAEKRERRAELQESVDESRIESARQDETRAAEYLEKVADKLDSLAAERDEVQGKIGGVKQDIRQLEELREQHEALESRVEALESLHEETERLEALYGDLRAELRQRNVETLERMLNETFDLVYGNDAYSHIRLDGEYELTVFQKDGTALEPEQLSGGERALFNLSLRTAIYRLLAEGIDGAAPMPPLILDEPTVFLDAGHVSRLVDLVEEMRHLGVRQIIIVSHDEELVGAADDLVRVEKDPTSNRSTVERVDGAPLASELVGDD